MTQEDQRLDFSQFLVPPLSLFRLAKTKYANLSGVGASRFPGRWNLSGQSAIYTSTEIAVPILERLVHTPKNVIPSNLSMMHLSVHGRWTVTVTRTGAKLLDPSTGGLIVIFDSLRAAQSALQGSVSLPLGSPFAIALPSVIVPVWNVVLYPEGEACWDHVKLESLTDFAFDARLFPENALLEREVST